MDLGRTGNFGFHEGVNWGAPLGDPWHYGYQVGAAGVQSDFVGNQTASFLDNGARKQFFLTAGIFHRALEGGLQGGVVFDYLHDSYFDSADLTQIRSETSLVFDCVHEVGYFGNYGINGDQIRTALADPASAIQMRPNDIYALFYRRHFSGGGQGRAWVGLSGRGDGLFGAEATVPLGTNWALANSFVYLLPKNGPASGGLKQESWSVAFSLVWYPGRSARCVYNNPYTPLFNVADNSTFLIRRQ